ncbi:hypothetical protein ACGFWE_41220 [Streptomyces sp. NPDC048523]|uniref:hypothetical protein n=1 Tax=Streptomyces sp. NPDC048523 TaxID=3365567 RepID=UPI003713C492
MEDRPVLLLVGDETCDHSWARLAIERRYRLLSPPAESGGQYVVPPSARGVVTFREDTVDRALSLAESAGLPTAPLRTAVHRRDVERQRPFPSDGSTSATALTAIVVSAVLDGRVSPLFLARPEREARHSGYVVEGADPLLRHTSVTEAVCAAHQDSGIHCGLTATEIHVAGWGNGLRTVNPRVNGLLGTDPLLRAGSLATGIDCALIWADLAAGAEPDLIPRRNSAAAVRFIYLEPELVSPTADLNIDDLPGGIWEVHLVATGNAAGEPGSIAQALLAVAVGENAAACRRALDLLPGASRLRHRPRPTYTDERNQRRIHA